MNTHLTLTLEKEVTETAQKYATEHGISLSEMVEDYFKQLPSKRKRLKPEELSPRVRRLRGIIDADEQIDTKKLLETELSK